MTRVEIELSTIPRMMQSAALRYEDQLAIVDGETELTYRALGAQIERFAAGLVECNVQPGDRVGIWLPNGWRWVVAALGALSAGAVLVPLNTRYKQGEADALLARSRAAAVVASHDFLGRNFASEILEGRGVTWRGIVVSSGAYGRAISWEDLQSDGDTAAVEVRRRVARQSGQDASDLIFTSGTTGRPKGVETSHAQNLRAFEAWADIVGLREGDRYLLINPMFHAFGFKAGVLAGLIKGATLLPEPVFDAERVLERVQSERIDVLPGPPTLYQSLLDVVRRGGPKPGVRLAVTGAAPTPVSLIEAMSNELGFERVVNGYGLTEACGVVALTRDSDDPGMVASTSGTPIPGVEVKIVDEHGDDVAPGILGEVQVRGYNVMRGYMDDDEATRACISADGWLATGDIGRLVEGRVQITDRKKDMVLVGGFNVYPAEVESVLLQRPEIARAAVVGVEDGRLGEVAVAFIVLAPDAGAEPANLSSWCASVLANFKVPRKFTVLEELPLNTSGKVDKLELRRIAREQQAERGVKI